MAVAEVHGHDVDETDLHAVVLGILKHAQFRGRQAIRSHRERVVDLHRGVLGLEGGQGLIAPVVRCRVTQGGALDVEVQPGHAVGVDDVGIGGGQRGDRGAGLGDFAAGRPAEGDDDVAARRFERVYLRGECPYRVAVVLPLLGAARLRDQEGQRVVLDAGGTHVGGHVARVTVVDLQVGRRVMGGEARGRKGRSRARERRRDEPGRRDQRQRLGVSSHGGPPGPSWPCQPVYCRKILVKSRGCWLISEHAGRPLALPPHG